jgi:very-short-patch-repair endonuclease
MLLDNRVKIRVNSKNFKSLTNYTFEKIGDIIEIDICDLSKKSHINIKCKCDVCGLVKKIQYKSYISNISKYNYYACSSKCAILKNELTNLDKLGVKYPAQSEIVNDKYKNTMIKRYGVDNSLKIDGVNEKAIKNSKSVGAKYKRKITNIERFGQDNISKSNIFFKNTKIGNDNNFIKYLGNNNCLFKCDNSKKHNFEISTTNYHNRINERIKLCTICNPIGEQKSIKEKELFNYIKSIYSSKIIQSYRDKYEIDIYLPELKIGIEFNGLYYHSNKFKDKNYHLDKTNYFKEKGIHIIHIWEDDYIIKLNLIKSQIKNWLNLTENKIFARKCTIKEIDDIKVVKQFLNDNHIQGYVRSNLKLGLYFNEELISLMTFDHNEGRKKMQYNEWNLSRFCNKLNTNVVGGASKLLSYFIKKYDVKRVISYADKDWSQGNLYYTLGFKKINESKPDYKYIIDGVRVHKSRFRKSNLNTELTESQYMNEKDIHKIWDCGKIKIEKKI